MRSVYTIRLQCGANNPTFQSDIFAPTVDDLSEYTIENMLPFIVSLKFPPGLSSFEVKYTITAAKDVGSSGRNFLFTGT
eukprot:667807-Pleurochrysis_carterae.AAC.9